MSVFKSIKIVCPTVFMVDSYCMCLSGTVYCSLENKFSLQTVIIRAFHEKRAFGTIMSVFK